MYQIVVVPNNTTANLSLSYKTKENANKAWESIFENGSSVNETDDFGYVLVIDRDHVSYFLFVDVEAAEDVKFERDMAINRAREKIQRKLDGLGYKPQKSTIIQ